MFSFSSEECSRCGYAGPEEAAAGGPGEQRPAGADEPGGRDAPLIRRREAQTLRGGKSGKSGALPAAAMFLFHIDSVPIAGSGFGWSRRILAYVGVLQLYVTADFKPRQ